MRGINWKTVAASVVAVVVLNNMPQTKDLMQGNSSWWPF